MFPFRDCFLAGAMLVSDISRSGVASLFGLQKILQKVDHWSSWSSQHGVFLRHPVSKRYTPLKLTVRTWKWMVGRRSFPVGMASWQVRTVSFREGISLMSHWSIKEVIAVQEHQLIQSASALCWIYTVPHSPKCMCSSVLFTSNMADQKYQSMDCFRSQNFEPLSISCPAYLLGPVYWI